MTSVCKEHNKIRGQQKQNTKGTNIPETLQPAKPLKTTKQQKTS